MENTPRLDVDAHLYSIVDQPQALTNISFSVTNLSPKLHTIADVEIFNMTNHKVFEDGYLIDADSNLLINASIPLPADFSESYEIKIGNEFTGYHHFIYRIELGTESTSISFLTIGVITILTGILQIISKRKKLLVQ